MERKNNLVINNIHFGENDHSETLYAELRTTQGDFITASTLDYIVQKLKGQRNNNDLYFLGEI